ncbi:MAG TPA: hypothetical protein VKR32_08920 [Puia sp.]|nr:hypothetical protein [Puia sp.]
METHAHELHKAPGHGLKYYFFEFFMLFLAVFCGFLAENLRESIVENKKERHYVESLVMDLKKDTAEVTLRTSLQNYIVRKMDSALSIPIERLRDIDAQDTFFHHFFWFYSWIQIFVNHDNTLTQLKNASGLSVIRNNVVVDSIGELTLYYDQIVRPNTDLV